MQILSTSALALALFSTSIPAFAGTWIANGRSYSSYDETVQPYYRSYDNMCHGNIPGPSGSSMYGEGGFEYGPCPNDTTTGWNLNFSVIGGQCRPNPGSVGGGSSCSDINYAINGIKYNGQIPTSCNAIGQHAVAMVRTVNLINFGSGDMPNDFYEEIREFAREYKCI